MHFCMPNKHLTCYLPLSLVNQISNIWKHGCSSCYGFAMSHLMGAITAQT